jgi:hypothetical protein
MNNPLNDTTVIPAKAGIQVFVEKNKTWAPAFAGATEF